MNKTIRPAKVLDYYDGVLVFTAKDAAGGQYIGSIIDSDDGIDRYLVKGAAPERINDLEEGRIDLRRLLLESPSAPWYLTYDGKAPDQPLELHPQDGPLAAANFLPADGYFIADVDTELPPSRIEKWLPINEIYIEAVAPTGNSTLEYTTVRIQPNANTLSFQSSGSTSPSSRPATFVCAACCCRTPPANGTLRGWARTTALSY